MQKNYSYPLLISGILLIIIAFSCKNDTDYGYPEISVSKPLPGSFYENGDTIKFQADFSDDNKLTSIEVMLVDMDNKPVLPVVNITPNKNPYSFQGDYYINDPTLPSGRYYLRFQASNGNNVTNKFVEVQLFELMKEMLYPIIVTHPETDIWFAYRLENDIKWVKCFTQTGDYTGCAVNSAGSQFYMCGNSISNLSSIRLPDGFLQWDVKPVYYQSNNWFGGIEFSYPNLFVSCAEGNIRGYNKTGNEIYKSETFHHAEPRLLVSTNNYVIAEFVDAFSSDKFLVTFHNPGGKMFGSKFFEGNVIDLIHTTGEKILVFSNLEGQGSISQYDATYNTLSTLHPFYSGVFIDAAKMDNDNYIISSSAGIYLYRLSNNSLTPLLSDFKDAKIECNTVSQQFYTCSANEMRVYSFPNPVLLQSIPLPDTVVDFHLVYNK